MVFIIFLYAIFIFFLNFYLDKILDLYGPYRIYDDLIFFFDNKGIDNSFLNYSLSITVGTIINLIYLNTILIPVTFSLDLENKFLPILILFE